MLKVPNVSSYLSTYNFFTEINQNKQLEVCIIYKTINKYGVVRHRMQNYLIYTDTRWPNIQEIQTTIDNHLATAKMSSKVIIRLDKARNYIWFNSHQFSGITVL